MILEPFLESVFLASSITFNGVIYNPDTPRVVAPTLRTAAYYFPTERQSQYWALDAQVVDVNFK
jgi:hypothetical protein